MDDDQLAARAAEAAGRARCDRCQAVILEAKSAAGAVTGLFRALATGVNIHFNLCGMCALGLREYLRPAILLDPMYLDAKRQLTEEAWT